MTGWANSEYAKCVPPHLAIIVILAALVRVALFFTFDYQKTLQGGDSGYYLEIGRNIVEHGVHGENAAATFYRPPLYSLFAGLVARVSETAAFFYAVQSVLFICFSVAVYFLLRRYGTRLAFASALLIAVSPFDALLNGRVLSENLATPLIVLATLAFISSRNSKLVFLVSGALLGGAVLCRDVYLLLPIFFLVTGAWMKISGRNLAVFLLGFALLTVPWVYRNSQLPSGGAFIAKGGVWTAVWMGTWERDPGWVLTENYVPPEAVRTFDNGNSPDVVLDAWLKRDQAFFKQVSIHYALNHPLELMETWIVRYPRLWFGTRAELLSARAARGSPPWYFVKGAFYLLNAIVIVLGLLGMIVAFRSGKLPAPLYLPVVYTALIYIPLHNAETRYSQPVMPILTIFCVFYVLFAIERWRGGSREISRPNRLSEE
jgi:hypothetical protein